MKVVLLNLYRAGDAELSGPSNFKHVPVCMQWMHHWQMLLHVSYYIFFLWLFVQFWESTSCNYVMVWFLTLNILRE